MAIAPQLGKPDTPPANPCLHPPVPWPKMSNAGHKRLIELSTRLEQLSSSQRQSRYRLALDIFEGDICCAALRAAMRTRGRACPPSTVPNVGKAKQRRQELLHRLENYLRQIQRRFEAEMNNPARAAKLLAGFGRYRRTLVQELFRHYPLVPIRHEGSTAAVCSRNSSQSRRRDCMRQAVKFHRTRNSESWLVNGFGRCGVSASRSECASCSTIPRLASNTW